MDDVLTLSDGSTYPRIAWSSVLDDATISSANPNETDGAVEQVADWTPWTFWRPTGSGPYIIEADFASPQTITAWAMAGHDASGLTGMDTWNGSAWVVFSEFVASGDGSCSYLTGTPVVTSKVRFRFTTLTFVSMLFAGQDLVLPEGVKEGWTDPNLGLRATTNPEVSRDGVWLGTAIIQWNAGLKMDIKNVEATWARDYWTPFLRQCSKQPFFLHWNNVSWPNSACLCTKANFGGSPFSGNGFVDLNVSFDADPGLDRRMTPISDAPALLLEDASGALLLEDG